MSKDSLSPVLKRTTPARTLARRRCPFQDGAVFSAGSNPDFDLCATVGEFHPAFLGRRIGLVMKRTNVRNFPDNKGIFPESGRGVKVKLRKTNRRQNRVACSLQKGTGRMTIGHHHESSPERSFLQFSTDRQEPAFFLERSRTPGEFCRRRYPPTYSPKIRV